MFQSEVSEKILRRRRQILVHSVIYYKMNDNIITDETWSKWALELEELQKKYPDISSQLQWAEEFADFNHSTGYDLPLDDPWAVRKAKELLKIRDERRR